MCLSVELMHLLSFQNAVPLILKLYFWFGSDVVHPVYCDGTILSDSNTRLVFPATSLEPLNSDLITEPASHGCAQQLFCGTVVIYTDQTLFFAVHILPYNSQSLYVSEY